jgi:hypothetical protein
MNHHIPDPTKMINDGGPAYPRTGADGHTSPQSGMTLRDFFAAAALKGQAHRFAHPHEHRELLAQDCYDIADAMLKAREAK